MPDWRPSPRGSPFTFFLFTESVERRVLLNPFGPSWSAQVRLLADSVKWKNNFNERVHNDHR